MNTYQWLSAIFGVLAMIIVVIAGVTFAASFVLDNFALFAGGSLAIIGAICAVPLLTVIALVFYVLGRTEEKADLRHQELMEKQNQYNDA